MSIEVLIAAPFTPMKNDFRINYNKIEELAEYYYAQPLSGIFINGTTGESMSLTFDERIELANQWVKYSKKNFKVIVHVGHTCLEDCKRLASHAQKIGSYAIGSMGPCFYKPNKLEDLVSFCYEIAKSAPQLPFYYYHMPSMTGNNFKMIDFLRYASDKIPNLAGIKYTDGDIMDYRSCVGFDCGRFDILFGRDQFLLAGLSLGAKGAVGSTYNYASNLYDDMIEAYKRGDMRSSQKYQDISIKIVEVLVDKCYPELTINKLVMKYYTNIDCGPARLPLTKISTKDEKYVQNLLEQLPQIN